MSIPVVCSNCSARLNAPDSAAGKKVKCPKCQTGMVVPTPLPPEPGFEVVEEAPAPKKPVVRPKVKTDVVVEDDEDEPTPRKKRVSATIEDHEKPRRKQQATDDDKDEEDDQPRKKKKRAAENSMMTRNIIGGVVLLVLVGVAGWVFYDKFGKSDDTTAGDTKTNQPGRTGPGPGEPGNPDGFSRLARLQQLTEEYRQVTVSSTETFNTIADQDTALSGAGQLRRYAERLRQMCDEAKAAGPFTTEEVNRAMSGSPATLLAHTTASTRAADFVRTSNLSVEAKKAFQDARSEFGRATVEFSATLRSDNPALGDSAKIAKAQAILDEGIRVVQSTIGAFNRVSDDETARGAAREVQANASRLQKLADDLRGVGELTPVERKRLRPAADGPDTYEAVTAKVDALIAGGKLPAEAVEAVRNARVAWRSACLAFAEVCP